MNKKPLVLITGGSSGLGKCLAIEFLNLQKNICLIARNEGILRDTRIDLKKLYPGCDILLMSGNVADESFVDGIYEKIDDMDYYPEYLINCAGIGEFGKADMVSKRMIDNVFEGNLIGLMLMCGKALKYMIYGKCYIVNIMSTAALRGKEYESVYCAAKWGARGYTEALKRAVENTQIQVVGVFPGGMKTSFWKKQSNVTNVIQNYMDPQSVAKKILNELEKAQYKNIDDIIIEREKSDGE